MKKYKKIQIGIIGSAGKEEYPKNNSSLIAENLKISEMAGFLAAKKGAIVVTGGKGGIMEAAAKGAKKANGITIGIISSGRKTSNKFTDIEVISGSYIEGLDEFILVSMCDVFIVVGGGAGTLQEIAIAYRNKKPIIAIKNTGGWADKTIGLYLDERKKIKIESAINAREAVKKAFKAVNHHNNSF